MAGDGESQRGIFSKNNLHLNDKGYLISNKMVKDGLKEIG
jgi:lysophospholipase L1-like esterase